MVDEVHATPSKISSVSTKGTHIHACQKKCVRAACSDIHRKDGDSGGDVVPPARAPTHRGVFRQEDLRDGDFLRESLLGKGSYSVVSAALHLPSSRMVALKQISRHRVHRLDLERQLRWEINVHRTLRHSNIVRLYSYYVTPHYITLVLEYCPGGTLMQRVRSAPEGSLSEACAARYARHVARALHYLHSHHILHRDLKLENVVLDRNDVAKLTDFGWSKKMACVGEHLLDAPESMDSPTVPEKTSDHSTRLPSERCNNQQDEDTDVNVMEGQNVSPCATPQTRLTVCGTLDYLSPEMVSRLPYTEKTDVWSLGIMIAEMLTGAPPFYRATHSDTLHAIRVDAPNLDRRAPSPSQLCDANDHDMIDDVGNTCTMPRDMPRSQKEQKRIASESHNIHSLQTDTPLSRRIHAAIAHSVYDAHSSVSLACGKVTPHISSLGRDLVLSMLNKDFTRRPSIADVLKHPWIQKDTWRMMLPTSDTSTEAKSTIHSIKGRNNSNCDARSSSSISSCPSNTLTSRFFCGDGWMSSHCATGKNAHTDADAASDSVMSCNIAKQSQKRDHET